MLDPSTLIESLINKVDFLEAENKSLRFLEAENTTLRLELAKLKEQLGLNSKNSSIPSSKELYKAKQSERIKSSRKPGGQPGHIGSSRPKMIADEIIDLPLTTLSCTCGGHITLSNTPYVHQKVDLPEIKPYVIDYQLHHGRCRKCGKRRTATLPKDVTSDTFGPRVKAVIAALTGFYKNSRQEAGHILKDLFNLPISIGSISNSEARVALKCAASYQTIEQQVSQSNLLHIDETSHYTKGKLGWCWMFTNHAGSILKLTDSRGMKVLENSIFTSKNTTIVTDRYTAYNYFSSSNRQICWAHLARDFERFAHSTHIGIKTLGFGLKQVASELFALAKALLKNKKINLLLFLRRARKLRRRTWYYLKGMLYLSDAVHAIRVAKNIIKVENMIWKFLEDPENIPLTNNLAERQIRQYVVYRKNSYFTQSERGNTFLERIISLYLTWKQQRINPFQNLIQIIA